MLRRWFLRICRFELGFDKTSKSSKKRFIKMIDLNCSNYAWIPIVDILSLWFHFLAPETLKALVFCSIPFFWICAILWCSQSIVEFIIVRSWIKSACNLRKIFTVTFLNFLSFWWWSMAFSFFQFFAAGDGSIWIA